jgi:hypothetical protein
MKFDETFKYIVSNPKLDHFSALELRTAYLIVDNECQLLPSETRRFVYAELVKLVKVGWLKKVKSEKRGITNYVITELFDLNFNVVSPIKPLNKIALIETPTVGSMQELNCRLQDYKNDLLEGLAEADEYRALKN